MKRGFILIFLLACFFTAQGQSTGKYQIKFLEINKSNSDYGVAILDENKLVFTSADDDPAKVKKNYNARKDLYVGDIDFDGEIKNVKPVVTKMDKKFNQTGLAYTKDRKTVYFSRNKYWKKKKKQNNPKNKNLQLYSAQVEPDGSWTNIEKLAFNKNGSTISHPVLSADNKQLYFVSDMKPSNGKTDIFVVDILENGKYSKPRNLGKYVNTEADETTPFISNDNILYFSSEGHKGLGKLDVFAVEIYEDNTTSEHYQLASPINSINDDFAYIVNEDNNQGFFTSNRLQGEGFNDLYSFTLEEDVRPGECFITVDGKVRDRESLELLSGATVDLYSLTGELLESVSTYQDGTYKFTVSCAKEYKLKASNPNYETDEKRIEILEENYHSALHANMNLNKIRKDEPIPASALQPIYYEFDRSTITAEAAQRMDKIIDIMKSNPDLIIETSSYTDSRGSDSYNLQLSKRRAKAAIEYLTSKGIDATRIKSNAYGEDKLINQCVNGANCDEHSHGMNRRTEFNFVNNPTSRTQSKRKESKTVVSPSALAAQPVKKPEPKQEAKAISVQPVIQPQKLESKSTAVVPVEIDENRVKPNLTKTAPSKIAAIEVDKATRRAAILETNTINDQEIAQADLTVLEKKKETLQASAAMETKPVAVASAPVLIESDSRSQTEVVALSKSESQKEVYRAKPEASKSKETNSLIAEEREEVAAMEREKASYRTDEKKFEKAAEKDVQEAVVINYNSTIVATNPESNKVLNYIGSEKIKMIEKLNEIQDQYETSIPKYPSVADSLSVEKSRIEEVIVNAKNLEETGWSNIIEYKNNVLHFKKRYRELVVENNRGTVAGSEVNSGPGSISLMEEPKKNKVEVASVPEVQVTENSQEIMENLTVDEVQVTAMKKNGNGKYQITKSANKTDLIKVTFKLKSNQKVNIGRKEAHLVLQNPEGNVEEAKGIFTIRDSQTESKYTDHAIINYNNHDVDVTMFVQRKGNQFEKGVYPVKLFVEGELMAVSNLNLKNPY